MYSPVSPRKAAFGSSKNSPRKPLLSPSEINPFSFSSETLNLFDNDQLQQNNGIIPMSLSFPRSGQSSSSLMGLGAHSQPRTPTSGHIAILQQNVHSAPGRSLSLGGSGSLGGGGSTGTAGRSIREFDETVRELRKENFNLKLRIYFLEERLGSSRAASTASAGSKEDLLQSNYDLKFQCESQKYEIREKADLLAEAGLALEQLESRLATLSREREDERARLEEKLRQLEDDLGDSSAPTLLPRTTSLLSEQLTFSLSAGSTPNQSPAKSARKKMLVEDEDETLLHEVEEEMKRGVEFSSPTSSKDHCSQTSLPCQASASSSTSGSLVPGLAVLEEKDEVMVSRCEELEQQVEQLSLVIHDTEFCLEQRAKQIRELEGEVSVKNFTIDSLKKEKHLKAEEVVKAQKEVAELSDKLVEQSIEHGKQSRDFEFSLSDLQEQLDQVRCARAELLGQASQLQELMQERDKRIKSLTDDLAKKEKEIEMLKISLEKKPLEPQALCQCKSDKMLPSESDYQVFSSPRPRPHSLTSGPKERGNFQIVTQTLHIPPTRLVSIADVDNQSGETDGDSMNEASRLKRDMRKLKEYLKTSVQERKLLLKKIGTLNERVAEVNLRKSMSPARKNVEKTDAAIQCDPIIVDKNLDSVVRHLSVACQGVDTLRSRLETVSSSLDRDQPQHSAVYTPTLDEMKAMTRRVVDDVTNAVHLLSFFENDRQNDILTSCRRSSSSMSVPYLPDPTDMDLSFVGPQIVDENVRQKLSMFDVMEQQLEDKDKVIQGQHDVLQEYRAEICRLRDPRRCLPLKPVERPKRKFRRSADGATRSEAGPNIAREPSEEYDTWSEPDVGASRTRMGLSRHVLALIERTGHSMRSNGQEDEEDSSELEKSRREKLKSFYSLDYTGQDFSDIDELEPGLNPMIGDSQKDYSKIIEELQSHRREIEKLHIDLANLTPSAQINQGMDDLSQQECAIGSLRCLLNGLHEFSRTMDELAYQVDLSETVDSGNVSGDEADDDPDFDDSEEESGVGRAVRDGSKEFDEFHVDLCLACSNSLPLELEHCIHRCGTLLAGSAFSLQRLRHTCCRLRSKLRRRNQQLMDKRLLLSQLEESVLPLREKAETVDKVTSDLNSLREDLSKKSREIQELQAKMNDNYKLVAELSAENLKLSSEKLRMEQLVNEVRQEEDLLRGELNKAQSVVESINANSPRLSLRKFQQHLNRPRHLHLNADNPEMPSLSNHNSSGTARSSSSETSSSFDFFPPGHIPTQYSSPQACPVPPLDQPPPNCNALSHHQRRCAACFGPNGLPDTCRPPPPIDPNLSEIRSPMLDRRGKYNNNRGGGRTPRGGAFFHKGRQQWRGGPPDYASDHPREPSRGRRLSFEKGRPQSTTGINSEVSSPDLGVDLGCSDPFSSLERSQGMPMPSERGREGATVDIIIEENRQLRKKLAESRGALRDTVDRLAESSRQFKKEQWLVTNTRPPRLQQQQQQQQQLQPPPPLPQPQILYYQDGPAYTRSPNKPPGSKTQTPTHNRSSSSQRNSK